MVRVCFVCLGNICRSPTAEGIMRALVREAGLDHAIEIDSAGTAAYHVGEPPDRRAAQTAETRGIELGSRGRQFTPEDFDRFDYVLAMDESNARHLRELAPSATARAKVRRLREFQKDARTLASLDVPDPYYGGASGFEDVFDMCHDACSCLLQRVRQEQGL